MKKSLMFLLLPLLLLATCTKGGGGEDVITLKEPKAAEKDTIRTEKPHGEFGAGSVIISGAILLRVSDAQGNDLLNPASMSPKAVDASKLKLYWVIDGKEELFYRRHLDNSTGISLITPKGSLLPYYLICVGLNIESKEKITETILEWKDGQRDVFKTQFHRSRTRLIRQKIWLNDKLILDIPNRFGPKDLIFEIKR